MNRLVDCITNCLLNHNIIEQEYVEEYIYAFQIIIWKIINYSTLLALSVCNKCVLPSTVFMIIFLNLRGRTGGYHAKTPTRCYIITISSYLLIMNVIAPIVGENIQISIAIIICASIIVFIFTPVNHPNLDLNDAEIRTCRSSSRCIVLVLAGCIGIAYMLSVEIPYITYIALGLGLDAVSICIAKLIRQEVKENDAI